MCIIDITWQHAVHVESILNVSQWFSPHGKNFELQWWKKVFWKAGTKLASKNSYCSAFGIRVGPLSEKLLEKFILPKATPEALLFFYCHGLRVGIKISQDARMLVCPTSKFLQAPAKSAFKRLILETPLYQHLLLSMSSIPTSELNDAECEKGHVTQRGNHHEGL